MTGAAAEVVGEPGEGSPRRGPASRGKTRTRSGDLDVFALHGNIKCVSQSSAQNTDRRREMSGLARDGENAAGASRAKKLPLPPIPLDLDDALRAKGSELAAKQGLKSIQHLLRKLLRRELRRESLRDKSIDLLGLSARLSNALKRAGICYLDEVDERLPRIDRVKNVGEKMARELEQAYKSWMNANSPPRAAQGS